MSALPSWHLRLAILVAGLVVFSLLHSILASDGARAWSQRTIRLGGRPYRVTYNVLAGGLLCGVWAATRGEYPVVWRATGAARLLLFALQFVAFAGLLLTLRGFDVPEFLGLCGAPRRSIGSGLQTRGMYTLCRHPLYLTTATMFSALPAMDLRWLVVAAWLWVYACVGSVFEERRLVRVHGESYRAYQASCPRLIPLRWHRMPRGSR